MYILIRQKKTVIITNNIIFYIQIDDTTALGVQKINTILESFMGISDTELGKLSWM